MNDSAPSQSNPSGIVREIEKLRRNLLDIGTRNRLISAPLRNSRGNVLEVIDEKSDEVFQAMWRDGSTFTFLANEMPQPGAQDGEDAVAVYLPPDDDAESGVAVRHKDNKLQTRLGAEALQKRLLALQRDSALFEEEQGANILFLAVGFLKWFEAGKPEVERFAPLLLVPVSLERDKVRSRFRLRRREEDIEANLSLRAMLEQDFAIALPDLPEGEDWRPTDYFKAVEETISTRQGWAVQRDAILLGFFSFSKFLLYRDLDIEEWPQARRIEGNALVSGLLLEGFDDAPLPIGEDQKLDPLLVPADLGHVLDADASQAAVIKMVADGRNMVVQGPPGTGKSQTIANVIAAATRQGKTVLFIAEKMAALEVVYERLRANGLDALCLELHSNKANKRAVYEELKKTLDLGRVSGGARDVAVETRVARDRLNALSDLLHNTVEATGETPFRVLALLVKLREEGIDLPDFSLDIATLRDDDKHKEALRSLERLASRTASAGPSRRHPWRGVGKRLTPIDLQRLRPRLEHLRDAGIALEQAIESGIKCLGALPPGETTTGQRLLAWLDHFARMPPVMRELLVQEPVRQAPDDLRALLAVAQEAARTRAEATAHISEVGLTQDWTTVRQCVAMRGRSLFRFLSGEFRRSVALLDAVSRARAVSHEERLKRLDSIIACQLASRRLIEREGQGKAAFGARWLGERTDAAMLDAALAWYVGAKQLPGAASALDGCIQAMDAIAVGPAAEALRAALSAFEEAWLGVRSAIELDITLAFAGEGAGPNVRQIVDRVSLWLEDFDRLDEWFALAAAESECHALGLAPFVERLANGSLASAGALDCYRFARAETMWREMIARLPELGSLRGDERTGLVQRFRDLERELFVATAREIAARHAAGIPSGAQGQMGFVRAQIARRRGHASVRKLMETAGDAVQRIKPIFLMSPISVAQFLPPGSVGFDLVLMDEASQVRPEDAIGAIARGRNVTVVGDTRQLPPTSFFDRTIGAAEDDEADDSEEELPSPVSAGVMESILTLCQARGLPARTLQWHYRSRHPSLIEVSNQAFYENKLKFPPSPERAGRDGLVFHRVDGIYDRGKTRTNAIEARAVAHAVIVHARDCPALSLGVATLSVAQRDAILAELELLRARHPDLESFFDRNRREAFFVKNLENVQGDERDVIFVSIGYARTSEGYMAQGFGPVSAEGGERRLNVLFTRAKRRCEIFSSISHADVALNGTSVPVGRRVLHTYLKFAETGETDVPRPTGLEPDSDFEHAVGRRIRSAGYEVDFQVGSAGFRIDIGVRDPGFPNVYALGVECDGASYHGALWARERDRLRQQVLESKGWRLHRIWSTDWFNRPDAEFRKLLAAIDQAKAAYASDLEAEREAQQAAIEIERDAGRPAEQLSVPYREADIPRLADFDEPHLVPVGLLAKYVAEVVSIEQPIHTDEIAKRVARAWGAQRTGARIRASVEAALAAARTEGKVEGGPFWMMPGGAVQVRDRSDVSSTGLRHPDLLPPAEVDEAIRQAVIRNVAIGTDEVARAVAETLGFNSTSAPLKALVQSRTAALVAAGALTDADGLLRIPNGASEQSKT